MFAYKVADGLQTAVVEAARASPDSFLDRCADAGGHVHAACAVIVLAAAAYVAWLFMYRRRRPPTDVKTESRDRHETPL